MLLRFTAKSRLAIVLALAGLSVEARALAEHSDPKARVTLPASIGAFGDSMTAGALAMFRRQDFVLPWTELLVALRALAFGITRNFDNVEARKLSWAAGFDKHRRVESHGFRLAKLHGLDRGALPTMNAAISGAESGDMVAKQIRSMTDWSARTLGQAFPDYVTLMIGANDVCMDRVDQMISPRTYYANVTRVVDEVLLRSPRSRLVVSALPNIEILREVARDARLYWGVKCEQLWKAVKFCDTLTLLTDPEDRRRVARRVVEYNEVLRDIVESRRRNFGDRIRFAPDTYQARFSADDLSIDCFHPNARGQAQLAERTWKASWWTEEWKRVRPRLLAAEEQQKRDEAERRRRDRRLAYPRR